MHKLRINTEATGNKSRNTEFTHEPAQGTGNEEETRGLKQMN